MGTFKIHRLIEPDLTVRPTSNNYMSFYEDELGITWDHKHFEIHHIDCNHDNNVLKNLVLLPKWLHRAVHGKMFSEEEAFELFCTSSGWISEVKVNRVQQLAELKGFVSEYIHVRNEILRCRLILGDEFNPQEYWDSATRDEVTNNDNEL